MTSTCETGWDILETLGTALGRPPRKRDSSGRWVRADGGEWDWFYALDDGERDYVRRRFMVADGSAPDQLAAEAGFEDVEVWAQRWMEAIRLTRPDASRWYDAWDRADYDGDMPPERGVLVGPAEVADLLNVKPSTVHQWVTRKLLPEPWDIVSGTRLWPRHVLLAWAEQTGRLPAEPLPEQF